MNWFLPNIVNRKARLNALTHMMDRAPASEQMVRYTRALFFPYNGATLYIMRRMIAMERRANMMNAVERVQLHCTFIIAGQLRTWLFGVGEYLVDCLDFLVRRCVKDDDDCAKQTARYALLAD